MPFPLDLNIWTDSNLAITMVSLITPKTTKISLEEMITATRAINAVRVKLATEIFEEVRYLARSLDMKTDRMVKSYIDDYGKSDIRRAEGHLRIIFKKLKDQDKATDDRILKDLPNAVGLVMRGYFLDGKSICAVMAANHFGERGRLQKEMEAAYLLNMGMGTTWTADTLKRTTIAESKLFTGQTITTVLEPINRGVVLLLRSTP